MGKKIVGIIEKADDGGFSIYTEELNGVFGYGLTEEEAKNDFIEVLHEQAEYFNERKGYYPEWHDNDMQVAYVYDLSGFILAFPVINVSAFAKELGINESLMRKYKNRISFAGEKQMNIIKEGYSKLLNRMQAVKF